MSYLGLMYKNLHKTKNFKKLLHIYKKYAITNIRCEKYYIMRRDKMLSLRKNILKVLVIMLIVVALIIPATSFATDDSLNVITPGTPSPSPVTPSSPTVKTTTTPIATPNVTSTPQSNLPQTGIEDYTGLVVITVLLGASAIFAYKKIKDYDKF